MNLLFSIKDFNLRIDNSTFFETATLSPGNYDDDIDQIIHSFLLDKVENKIDSFTIPISLSNNFMEFSGLLLAHHVRLSREFKFCDVPIVFYGSLKLEQLLRLTPLARVLLTSNVLYVEISKYSFDDIQKSLEGYKTKLFDINTFLDQIQIKPPANYDSHHSVDNEFALIQWSKSINCYDRLPNNFKKEYDSNLYLKYLKLKHTLPNEELQFDSSAIVSTNNINILLIDDEAMKGWEAFYSSLFSSSSKRITFKDSGIDFKNIQTKEDIISKIELIISAFKPDVVLLDLRLLDSDFLKETLPNELTGLKVLEKIKEINKGIQVIITTASNKAWNFNLAKQKGAYDFIIKDGFEDPRLSITKLSNTIESASKRSLYLKPIYEKMINSLKAWNAYQIPKRKNISDMFHDPLWHVNLKLQVNDFINNAFDTINNDAVAERFTISTVLLYRVIEMINEFYIIESGDNRDRTNQYHFDYDNSKVPKIIYNQNNYSANSNIATGTSFSTKEKSYAIYHKINSNTNKDLFNKIHILTEYRNKVTIHPTKRFKEESLEYVLDSDFIRFNCLLIEYFSAILDFINSFKKIGGCSQ
jgi:CheY-like chemotaxis protein